VSAIRNAWTRLVGLRAGGGGGATVEGRAPAKAARVQPGRAAKDHGHDGDQVLRSDQAHDAARAATHAGATFTAQLDLPPAILSPNVTGAHWSAKTSAIRAYRKACWVAFWSARPSAWVRGPVELEVEYRCPRGSNGYVAYDVQNAMAAMKAGIDALVDAGVVETDSHHNVRWGRFTLITRADEMRARGKHPGITIIVSRI
jgi:hypothetical protein